MSSFNPKDRIHLFCYLKSLNCNNVKLYNDLLIFLYSLARSSKNFEFIRNVTFETRSINTTTVKKSYPHLRILARTSSTSRITTFYIYSIKIRYYFCEKKTIYNTDLSQVYSSTTNISKLVHCHENTLASDGKSRNITVKCTPEGNWTFGDRKCVCDRGFHFNNQSCSRK
jgi:hypothetical protein